MQGPGRVDNRRTMPRTAILALTLDLDDTLWPVMPVIARAERAQRAWLEAHAPATAAAFDAPALRRLRTRVDEDHPGLRHDLSALRRATLRRAVEAAGEPVHLADQAFEVFFAARQEVDVYPDVLGALGRLAARYPLWSLSNGNADLQRVGLADYFQGALSAGELGAAKPDPRIFGEACRRIGLASTQILHVGDDLQMDVLGAHAAGLQAAWVRRGLGDEATGDHPPPADVLIVPDLQALADRLGC